MKCVSSELLRACYINAQWQNLSIYKSFRLSNGMFPSVSLYLCFPVRDLYPYHSVQQHESPKSSPAIPALPNSFSLTIVIELHLSAQLQPPVISIGAVEDSCCTNVDFILSVTFPRLLGLLAPFLSIAVHLDSGNDENDVRKVGR